MSDNGNKNYGKADLGASTEAKGEMSYGARYFKLEGGQTGFRHNYLRILPPHVHMTDSQGRLRYFHPSPVHYNIGPPGAQQVIGCARLAKTGECPVCQQAFLMKQEGLVEEAKDFMPTWNAYLNVVKLQPPTEGEKDLSKLVLAEATVYVLAVRSNVLNMLDDEFEEFGDMTDLEEGANIDIKRKGTSRQSEYKIKVSGPCAFPGDLDVVDDLIDVTRLAPFLAYDRAKALLEGDRTGGADPFAVEESPAPRLVAAREEDDEEEEEAPAKTRAMPEEDEEEEEETPPAKKSPGIVDSTARVIPDEDEDEGPHPDGCRCADCKTTRGNGNGATATDDPETARAADAKERLQGILARTRTKAAG